MAAPNLRTTFWIGELTEGPWVTNQSPLCVGELLFTPHFNPIYRITDDARIADDGGGKPFLSLELPLRILYVASAGSWTKTGH